MCFIHITIKNRIMCFNDWNFNTMKIIFYMSSHLYNYIQRFWGASRNIPTRMTQLLYLSILLLTVVAVSSWLIWNTSKYIYRLYHIVHWKWWLYQYNINLILKSLQDKILSFIEKIYDLRFFSYEDVFQPKTGCLLSFSGMLRNLFWDCRNRTNSR